MPELPDITVYIEAIEKRTLGRMLNTVRIGSPFLLRSVAPPVGAAEGRRVRELRRVGKRIAIGLENDVWLVLHLMDRRTAALEKTESEAGHAPRSGGLRF